MKATIFRFFFVLDDSWDFDVVWRQQIIHHRKAFKHLCLNLFLKLKMEFFQQNAFLFFIRKMPFLWNRNVLQRSLLCFNKLLENLRRSSERNLSSSQDIWTTEYSELARTHKDHWVQLESECSTWGSNPKSWHYYHQSIKERWQLHKKVSSGSRSP